MQKFKPLSHKGYLEKRDWACDESPTGAHWWVGTYSSPKFECKYCHKTKAFLNTMPHEQKEISKKTGTKGRPHKLSHGCSRKPYVKH